MGQCDWEAVIAEDYSLPSPEHSSCFWFSSIRSECSPRAICIPTLLIHSMTTGTALVKMVFAADQLPSLQP